MAVSAFYSPSASVYGFLSFGQGYQSGFLIGAFGNSGAYNYVPGDGISSAVIDSAPSGFGPIIGLNWILYPSPSNNINTAAFANGAAFDFSPFGATGQVYVSGAPLSPLYPYSIMGVSPITPSGFFVFDSVGNVSAIGSGGGASATQISGTTGAPLHQSYPNYTTSGSVSAFYFPGGPSGLLKYSFSGVASGALSAISLPASALAINCCCSSGSLVYCGGQANAMLGGIQTMAVPQSPSGVYLFFTSGGNGTIVASNKSSTPGLFTTISCTTGLGFAATGIAAQWYSSTGFLVIDTTNNKLTPYTYAAGVISAASSISATSAVMSIGCYSGVSALVPQTSSSGLLAFYLSGSNWVSGGTGFASGVTGVSPGPLAIYSNVLALCYASGLIFASPNASGYWVPFTNISLSNTPLAISVDAFGNFFTAGSGYGALYSSGGQLLGSGVSYSGIVVGCASYQSQYYIQTKQATLIMEYQSWNNSLISAGYLSLTNQKAWIGPTGYTGTASSANLGYFNNLPSLVNCFWAQDTLIACDFDSRGAILMGMASPFTLQFYTQGIFSILSGNSYINTFNTSPYYYSAPQACGIDASGNIRFSATDGGIYIINSGGIISYESLGITGGLVGLSSGLTASEYMWGAMALGPGIIGFF